jgi:hypothetical protein
MALSLFVSFGRNEPVPSLIARRFAAELAVGFRVRHVSSSGRLRLNPDGYWFTARWRGLPVALYGFRPPLAVGNHQPLHVAWRAHPGKTIGIRDDEPVRV